MSKRNSSDIRLSEKHGANPTLCVCFFCGEDSGEIALLGKLKGDAKAPKRMVLNYEPCAKCREKFNMGVPLIECDYTNSRDVFSISKDGTGAEVYPTGRWCVIQEDSAKSIFGEIAKLGKPICIDQELFDKFVHKSASEES